MILSTSDRDRDTIRQRCEQYFAPSYSDAARELLAPKLVEEIPRLLDALDQAEQQREALVAELLNQWEYNHAEHCTNDWPHEGICKWPQPDILKATGATPEDPR